MLAALDSVYGQRKDNPHFLRPKKRPYAHFRLPILSQSLGSEGSAVVRPSYESYDVVLKDHLFADLRSVLFPDEPASLEQLRDLAANRGPSQS